jgi:lipoprotein-anchoring transpeptidase ErfK/SrfK
MVLVWTAALIVVFAVAAGWPSTARAQEGQLLSPAAGAAVQGMVTVRGLATHHDFRKWQLDLVVQGDGDHAHFLALSEQPAEGPTIMATFDSRLFPDGVQYLRLRVVRADQNYDEYFQPILIANSQAAMAGLRGAALTTPRPTRAAGPVRVSNAAASTPTATPTATPTETPTPVPTPIIRTDVPDGDRWITVDLSDQWLVAYQGEVPVFEGAVSTGMEGWHTLPGEFSVYLKYEETRMRGEDYDTPDVPWTMYYSGDFAIHGAYWHQSFGTPVSHGCVNLPVDQAQALYEWAPIGTRVVVTR